MKMINTSVFFLKTSFVLCSLVCLLPNLVKAQDVPSQQDLPKVNPDIQLLLSQPNQDIPLKLVDAVYLALQNNRDVKIAYLQRIVDKARLSESESIFSCATPAIFKSECEGTGMGQSYNNRYNNRHNRWCWYELIS